MATSAQLYTRGVKKQLSNYWPAWLPSTRFELGDIGVIDDQFFSKVASLDELGIEFTVREDSDPSSFDLASESKVSVEFGASGQAETPAARVGEANANVKIEFGSAGAFFIKIPESFETSIDNLLGLRDAIIAAYAAGTWEQDWVVITRLVSAPSAMILVSNSDKSSIALNVAADATSELMNLGKADVGFSWGSHTGGILKVERATNVTPFFQVSKLRKPWFGKATFRTRSAASQTTDEMSPLAVAENDMLRESLIFDELADEEIDER